ncbi:neutral amino acid permease [Fusarium sp. NRRL 25303]|nr:neutral amino acid permease [Fusarium sp. NRRL 25303]
MGIVHANNREPGTFDPAPILSQEGLNQDNARPTVAHDEVFGDITEDGPNYRDVGWLGTSALMMKTQIGLGILSIPSAFHTLGLVPGLICLLVIGGITTWSDYIIGTFKLNHREVYGIDDAGGILFGRFGQEFLGISFSLFYVVTIAVSIQDRPSAAPETNLQHEWKSDYQLYGKPSFTEAMSALSTMVFAYAGTPLFFPIAAEMRDPRHYTKAMLLCQSVATATYIIVGVIIYYYCGSYVASPALGSAGKTIKQVAYGLALPGLIVGATINAHVTGKYVFVRALRGSRHLTANTLTHWATWLGLTFSAALLAYIIASAIPVFGSLVSLVGALLGTLQTFQPYGCFWLYDNWSAGKQEKSLKWNLMVVWSSFVILSGTFPMVAGTYGSVIGVIDSYKVSEGSAAFSCADNSNSV